MFGQRSDCFRERSSQFRRSVPTFSHISAFNLHRRWFAVKGTTKRNFFYFYPQRLAFRACCHYFFLFSRKFSCVPTGEERHLRKVVNDRTGERRGSNAYYKRVAKKLHSMFRIIPIFCVLGKRGEKGGDKWIWASVHRIPKGIRAWKKLLPKGFKAKPLRQSVDRQIGSGAPSRSRCERCLLPGSHRDMKHPHLFVLIFILVAVVMFSPVKMSEYRRCYVNTHGLHVIFHISQFLDRLLEALDIIMRLIIFPG